MNKLGKAVNDAVIECMNNGSGNVKMNDEITVKTEWETWEEDERYDVITIYVYQNGIDRLCYQDADTKVEND